jgi:hypothetical protein
MTRRLLAALFVTAVAFALTVRAEDPKKPDAPLDSKAAQDLATAKEKLLREEFDSFKNEVLKLKQRLETSDKEEDKATVKVLDSVLKEINNLAVDGKFDKVIESLQNDPSTFSLFQKANDIETANKELHIAMLKLIDLLQSGDGFSESRKRILANLRLLEKLREIKSVQDRQNAQIDRPNKSGTDLAKVQQRILAETKKTLDPNAGAEKKPGIKKSEAKDDGKPGTDAKGKAEAKNDTQGPKGETKEAKPGENKESKPGEGKPGETKDGMKPGEAKGGEAKEGKPGEGKEGKPGEGKPGEAKEGSKPGEAKPGEAKPGEAKEAKPGEGKGGEPKPSASKEAGKPGEGKPGAAKEGKPGEGKPSAGKSGSDSKGQKEGKGESKPGQSKAGDAKAGQSKGNPSAGQPGQSPPGEGKGEASDSASAPPPPAGPQMKQPVRKKIEEGVKDMEETKDKLDKDNKPGALPSGEKAADDIAKAIKNLEEIINADRQEEIERVLERLQARCARMLAMQIAVKDGTVKLDEKLQEIRRSKGDERPLALDSNVLSDREYEIVKEADRALALLENDGSAVAFAEMFQMVRKDMLTVKGRLAQTDVGVVTTGVEDEIIKNLSDMVEALKKQRQANKDKGQKPPPPGPPKPPGEDPLVDLIAQLKLLRSMQNGLNNRTGLYAKEYRGEQAPAPDSAKDSKERSHYEMIQKEMKELAETEAKISKILKDMLTGKNRAD